MGSHRSLAAELVGPALALAILTSCGTEANEVRGYPGSILDARSPSGRAVASVVEANTEAGSITQVLLAFDKCGLGPVSVLGVSAGLELEWLNDTTLQVRHPPESRFLGSIPPGDLDCGAGPVRVVLVSK
jgi:hypothetical protein